MSAGEQRARPPIQAPLAAAIALAAYIPALYVLFRYAFSFPLGLIALLIAAGGPAFALSAWLTRVGVQRPFLWIAPAFLLAAGIVTAVRLGPGYAPGDYALAAIVHAVTLTIIGLAPGGGYSVWLGNLLNVAIMLLCCIYGAESAGGGRARKRN